MDKMKPIYLDNAATSHPKPDSVYVAVAEALRSGGSPGRGHYQQAMSAERLVFETRELLAEFFNAGSSDRFVFTANATTAINQALFGLLKPGDRVVTTMVEHNAVSRPLRALQDRGVVVVKVAADPQSGSVSESALQQACLSEPTRLLVVNHCSNVIGSIQPITNLGRWCHDHGILFMLDGAQSAGYLPIDFQALHIDLFAAPGHKGLLGPQGTGFLYVQEDIELTPLIYGGTGANSHSDLQPPFLPERFESGTQNLPGIAGLLAGLRFLVETGVDTIRAREVALSDRIIKGFASLERVKLYGPDDAMFRGGAISFNIADRDPAEVGFALDQQQISVRVGLHCAPDAHRSIETYPTGTVRVSPGYFTTDAEVESFLQVIQGLCN
ncbi:cysteine desulfurase family protein [Desulfuromusa kysingii]|uniref:cysteine desulfurase n=1 Tax=Desulfuromusa kysingii TaxID=37625 RepID=A0A1H3YWT0_9BACT|nr:aminotransferase class V-fold PLP-dependent enzyme [Desulfuromusa kysingii]SEA15661.1 cysteine desulfurase family protein [Desulfuromusa kysingii]